MKLKHKPIILIGSGGHAGVLVEIIKEKAMDIVGIVDPKKSTGERSFGVGIIGDDDAILNFSPDEVSLVNGLGSLPGKENRWKITKKFRSKKYDFMSLVHPRASLSNDVNLGEGVQVMKGCILQHDVSIGEDTIINTGSIIDHDCSIGSNCHIAPGSVLSGGVSVGNNVHIGTGSTIIQNVKIGHNVIIAAGSVIYKDIEPNTTYIKKV